jgi:hypothetical protein
LAFFVYAGVIKCADEDISDSDYEHTSRITIHTLASVRRIDCRFIQWMR